MNHLLSAHEALDVEGTANGTMWFEQPLDHENPASGKAPRKRCGALPYMHHAAHTHMAYL